VKLLFDSQLAPLAAGVRSLQEGQRNLLFGIGDTVIDLQIAPGRIGAMVSGSDLYRIEVKVAAVTRARWTAAVRNKRASRMARR